MARYRTIKPEFWTSEQVVECSPIARLLFIGMWNFCDDGGNHPASVKTLKMEVFPGDGISASEVQSLLDQLVANRLLVAYEADGKDYWHVTGWHHQKIDRPTFKYPVPTAIREPLDDDSANGRRAISDYSRLRGEERSGAEQSGVEGIPLPDGRGSRQPPADGSIPDCPHQEIKDLYAKHLPMLPQPRVWEGKRVENLRVRWRWVLTAKDPKGSRYATTHEEALGFFDRLFRYIAKSDFLTGRNDSWHGCDLAWLVKAENFAKVLDGKYENKEAA